MALVKALLRAPMGFESFFFNKGGIGSCFGGPVGAGLAPALSFSNEEGSAMFTLTLDKGPFSVEAAGGTGTFP